MNKTNIGWTDYSVNPFKMELPDGSRVNVCIHKSEGCRHCYAEMLARRWWDKERRGEFPGYTAALLSLGRPVLVEEELKKVLGVSKRIADGKLPANENKVFWNDMTDEYLDYWPDEFIDSCWAVRSLTPNLIHQVLTKRAERLNQYLNKRKVAQGTILSSVWLGVSVEDQKTADERIPMLLETPAAVRWISAEPLLEPIDLTRLRPKGVTWLDCLAGREHFGQGVASGGPRLNWGVIGGESGSRHREIPVEDILTIIKQFRAAKVPIFVKQDSGPRPGQQGRIPNEYWIHEFPAGC